MVKPVLIKAPRQDTVRNILDEQAVEYEHSQYVIMVNGQNANLDTIVQPGERIIVLPAISGGS